ncbi:uncharacterized protein N7511_001422 [Penicillium nucicola]|uniref:uncharacterized protein n=1 Tax=Penicillium nucicola TaxID=1850975 RepID=UPI0025458792|nr:uncharacterized protein N7511_001422 [Penicillium nucicola]KAJ5776411.1 hypothetical protein N7511_001422 [Penicillium nucicola]
MTPAEDERPSKRARQACAPCRRKKSRCPGEKPVCSYCERLGQKCTYSGDEARSEEPEHSKKMTEQFVIQDERISGIESTLDRLMDYITNNAGVRFKIGLPRLHSSITMKEPRSYPPKLCQSVLYFYTSNDSDLLMKIPDPALQSYQQQIFI